MDLFDQLIKATRETGDILGLQYGIVADVKDPLALQRIQVYDQAKGGKSKSGWLMRGLPHTAFSPPLPKLGELVIFGYIGGDPHHGCYLGLVVNNNNRPVGKDSDWTLTLGNTKIEILSDGTLALAGSQSVTVKGAKNVSVESAETVIVKGIKVVLEASDELEIKANKVIYQTTEVDFGSPSAVKISGKNVTTEGARDTQGHTIVTKGW